MIKNMTNQIMLDSKFIRVARLREPSAEELFVELVQGTNEQIIRLREPSAEESLLSFAQKGIQS